MPRSTRSPFFLLEFLTQPDAAVFSSVESSQFQPYESSRSSRCAECQCRTIIVGRSVRNASGWRANCNPTANMQFILFVSVRLLLLRGRQGQAISNLSPHPDVGKRVVDLGSETKASKLARDATRQRHYCTYQQSAITVNVDHHIFFGFFTRALSQRLERVAVLDEFQLALLRLLALVGDRILRARI